MFFKVGAKIAKKMRQNLYFNPSKNEKPSVQKVPLYMIYEDFLHLKLICTHQANTNSPKTSLVEVKMWVSRILMCLVRANQF